MRFCILIAMFFITSNVYAHIEAGTWEKSLTHEFKSITTHMVTEMQKGGHDDESDVYDKWVDFFDSRYYKHLEKVTKMMDKLYHRYGKEWDAEKARRFWEEYQTYKVTRKVFYKECLVTAKSDPDNIRRHMTRWVGSLKKYLKKADKSMRLAYKERSKVLILSPRKQQQVVRHLGNVINNVHNINVLSNREQDFVEKIRKQLEKSFFNEELDDDTLQTYEVTKSEYKDFKEAVAHLKGFKSWKERHSTHDLDKMLGYLKTLKNDKGMTEREIHESLTEVRKLSHLALENIVSPSYELTLESIKKVNDDHFESIMQTSNFVGDLNLSKKLLDMIKDFQDPIKADLEKIEAIRKTFDEK